MIANANGVQTRNSLGTSIRVIALGYYDGPTEGAIEFKIGEVYRFTMPDEDNQLASQSTVRRFELSPLPRDAIDRIATTLAPFCRPAWPVWFPQWNFPSREVEEAISTAVDSILSEAGPVEWHLATSSYDTFENYHVVRAIAEVLTD